MHIKLLEFVVQDLWLMDDWLSCLWVRGILHRYAIKPVLESIKITCWVGNFYSWNIDLPQTVIKHLQSQILANTLCVIVLARELTSKWGQGIPSVSYLSVCAPLPYVSIKISLYALSQDCNWLNRQLLKSVLFLDESGVLQEALQPQEKGEPLCVVWRGLLELFHAVRKAWLWLYPQHTDTTCVCGSRWHCCARYSPHCLFVSQLILSSSCPGICVGLAHSRLCCTASCTGSAVAHGVVNSSSGCKHLWEPPEESTKGEMSWMGCVLFCWSCRFNQELQ